MVSPRQALALTLVAVPLLLFPGPSVLFVVGRGMAFGRRAGIMTAIGNELGEFCQAVAVALGLGVIVARSAVVFDVVKLLGAAYLIFLGIRTIRTRRSLTDAADPVPGVTASRRMVRDGFLVGVSNPKTTLFFLAVLPQFVDPARGNVPAQLLTLGVVFVLLALVNDSLYALAAGGVRAWLDRSPRRLAILGGTSGLVMIGLGVRLAFTGRKD